MIALRNGRSRSLSGGTNSHRTIVEEEPENNCPVCHTPYENEATTTTHCNHRFHAECLQNWTITHHSCPMCRAPIEY